MASPNQAALDFLLTRRSRPAKLLKAPAPDRDTLATILTAAARSPDHGKLEPWRFIVLEGQAMHRIAGAIRAAGDAHGRKPTLTEPAAALYETAPMAVVVVEKPNTESVIPLIEQTYSAGAVCLALLNAALAAGWGANWISGWASHNVPEIYGTQEGERIAGVIFLGTAEATPPERPRPDVNAITTWVSE